MRKEAHKPPRRTQRKEIRAAASDIQIHISSNPPRGEVPRHYVAAAANAK